MLNLNEQEIIRKFINTFIEKGNTVYSLNLSVRGLKIDKSAPTEEYKDFKNGKSSSKTEASFELAGWKSYAEDGIKSFMMSLLDEDDSFAPIVNIEIYEINNKGKTSVNAVFSIVYTGYDIVTDDKVKSDIKKGLMSKDDIVDEIEVRLSEIYTLLKKLRS